jgi:hypothetical protein
MLLETSSTVLNHLYPFPLQPNMTGQLMALYQNRSWYYFLKKPTYYYTYIYVYTTACQRGGTLGLQPSKEKAKRRWWAHLKCFLFSWASIIYNTLLCKSVSKMCTVEMNTLIPANMILCDLDLRSLSSVFSYSIIILCMVPIIHVHSQGS